MGDIKIKPMALFILTKGPSFVKISFYGVRPHFLGCTRMGGAVPPSNLFFYPGDLETSNSACIISNQFENQKMVKKLISRFLVGFRAPTTSWPHQLTDGRSKISKSC